MKKVRHYEVAEYTYETKEERDMHVATMYIDGQRDEGQRRKLKEGVSIIDATKDDYEWYACLINYHQ